MPWAEQLPSGKYRGVYRDRRGNRRSAGTFPHKIAAEKAAIIAEDKARSAGWRDPKAGFRTWGSWCEDWWATRPIEAGTAKRDEPRRDMYLLPKWGDVALADITRLEVKAWAAQLLRTRGGNGQLLAPSTVQRIVYMLSASLNAAIDAEILTTNPAYRIKIAKGETSSERFLSAKEFELLLAKMPTPFDQALAATLAGTGMRWGEAVGLQVQRVDLARGVIRVAEVWDDTMGRPKKYPKGRKARTIPVPDWVLDELRDLIGDRRTGLVFAKSTGRPPSSTNWRSRVWVKAVEKSKIGHVRVHDLRHTCASWLINDGWTLAEVGAHLGHTSPQTTQIYAHLLPTDRGRVLRAIPRPRRGADVGQTDQVTQYPPLRAVASASAE